MELFPEGYAFATGFQEFTQKFPDICITGSEKAWQMKRKRLRDKTKNLVRNERKKDLDNLTSTPFNIPVGTLH